MNWRLKVQKPRRSCLQIGGSPSLYVGEILGVSQEGNLRLVSKFKNRVTEEGKLKMPMATSAPSAQKNLPKNGSEEQQAIYDGDGVRSASLKDLCLEDKKRIANLIKELARVSEEKEVTEERLKAEQESFERKIRQMEEQNELIIKEREALQQQYRECQELLSLYQKYLSEQQEKLNRSISKLAEPDSKQQGSSKKRQPQSLHLEFDGSYLGVAGTQTLYQTSTDANRGLYSVSRHHRPNDPETRVMFQSTLQDHLADYSLVNGLQKRFNTTPRSLKHEAHHRHNFTQDIAYPMSENKSTFPYEAMAQCCIRTSPRNSEPVLSTCQSPKINPSAVLDSQRSNGNPQTPVLNGVLESREKSHGKLLPDERKQVLLLQKMELEIEKERLQQMLAQQEARLLLKQQQLQQSRLDYNRFRHENDIDPDEAFMKQGSHSALMNGTCLGQSPLKPPSSRTPASSKVHQLPTENSAGRRKTVGFSASPDAEDLIRPRNGFRREAGTSPALVRDTKDVVTTATSPFQPNMSRYDASLLNLVDGLSPVPAHRPQPLPQEPFDWSSTHLTPWRQRKPARRPVAATLRGRGAGDEELEESRILEEIFFI
ncbi:protein hinderin isoform X2 [Ambystoma mexicanum]|uniref:protein hinderin isoform X2 n=1 Tax=Ambystoma mexicanum TaxID=8296 RepID=UPI0037E8A6EB